MTDQQIDGREAYRDDADYTAPEMEPTQTTDELNPLLTTDGAVATAAGLSIGSGGGALAGQVLADELAAEREERGSSPEPETDLGDR
jgi:hypothetical protein